MGALVKYECDSENFAYGEINEWDFSNSTPQIYHATEQMEQY